VTLVHWDEAEGFDSWTTSSRSAGTGKDSQDAAGRVRVGLQRVRPSSGQLLTPPHVHSGEEEIYLVLTVARGRRGSALPLCR
jgi:hypothetical protein